MECVDNYKLQCHPQLYNYVSYTFLFTFYKIPNIKFYVSRNFGRVKMYKSEVPQHEKELSQNNKR